MKISYAKHADVLYVVIETTANPCVYVELESGPICRVDEITKQIVGITIPYFSRLTSKENGLDIPEINFHIDGNLLLQEALA